MTTEQKRTWSEKFLCLLRMILEFLTWLPLILTSVLFKIGSINLYMKFFGWYSAAMIISIICLNTAGIVCLSHLSLSKQRFSIWTENLPSTDETNQFHWSEGLFISFTNMFVISRPFNTIRKLFYQSIFYIKTSSGLTKLTLDNNIDLLYCWYGKNNFLQLEVPEYCYFASAYSDFCKHYFHTNLHCFWSRRTQESKV